MIIPDANLLIYAHDELAPHHKKAKAWWNMTLSGNRPIGVPWVVILAFTRLMTHPTNCANPLSIEQTRGFVESWFKSPALRVIQVSDRAVTVYFDLLEAGRGGGYLNTDALIAAHAREHSAVIYSNDRDFDRFPGIKRVNPLS